MKLSFIRKHRELSLYVLDFITIVTAYFLAYGIRTDWNFTLYHDYFPALIINMPWAVLINLISIRIFHLERSLWAFTSIDEVIKVTEAVFAGNLVWLLLVVLIPVKLYIRSVPIIAALLQLFFMLGLRIVYRLYRREVFAREAEHKGIIIGAGSAGVRVLREINGSSNYNTRIIGFVDKNPHKRGQVLSGTRVLGTMDDLDKIKASTGIDTAYIAIRNITVADLRDLVDQCQQAGLRTQIARIEFHNNVETIGEIRNVNISDLLGRGELHLNNAQLGEYLHGRTILVTGGGGSIGSELVRQMYGYQPAVIVIMDIYENNMYDLQQEIHMKYKQDVSREKTKLVCLIGSVRDRARIDQIMETYHPDIVFHAAAHKHVPLVEDSPLEAIKNNVFGTYNVIASCIAHGVKKFVMISTDKAVRTTNVMGATKRMCEMIVEAYRDNGVTNVCAVRFGNVLGSHGSVIPLFEKQIAAGGPVTVTDPNIIRYFMTIPEAAQLVLQAGAFAKSGEIYVLDMGKPVKIMSLAQKVIRLAGFEPDRDIKIKITGLRPGEKLYEELLVNQKDVDKTENNLIFVAHPEHLSRQLVQDKLAQLQDMVDKDMMDNQKIIQVVNAGTAMEKKNA